MPNFCDNYLIMEGNVEILEEFLNAANQDEENMKFLDFMRPMPDEKTLKITPHEWRLTNLGTKWEVYHDKDAYSDDPEYNFGSIFNGTLKIYFETAWSPPIEAVKYFCEKHGLHGRLHYYEEEHDFAGFYDSITDMFVDTSCNSTDIDLFIEGLDLFEEGKHFQIESILYFEGISSLFKEREDEMSDEDDSDESDDE